MHSFCFLAFSGLFSYFAFLGCFSFQLLVFEHALNAIGRCRSLLCIRSGISIFQCSLVQFIVMHNAYQALLQCHLLSCTMCMHMVCSRHLKYLITLMLTFDFSKFSLDIFGFLVFWFLPFSFLFFSSIAFSFMFYHEVVHGS